MVYSTKVMNALIPRAIAALALTATLTACPPSGPRTGALGETIYPTIPGGDHTKTQDEVVKYDVLPPMGGRHAGIWQNCGIYDTEIRNEPAVHALEHGAVWITYKPEISESDKVNLRQLAVANPYILLSPFPTMDAKITLSAWAVQLKLQEYDQTKIDGFLKKYMFDPQNRDGKDPQYPGEFGAQCAGGTGAPRR